jgi:glucose-1-phosphatase
MADDEIGLVLFDLGGVLMRVSGVAEMARQTGIGFEEAVWARWLGCEWVRRFERGRCSIEEFAAGIIADWGLDTSPEEFADSFRRWPDGLYPGAAELVGEVRAVATVGCLSNSNALHWSEQLTWGMADWFDHAFLSHEMGLIKPDPEVFHHVADVVGLAPGRITFLDDNRLNVDAATDAGFLAHHVRGVDEARGVLVEIGVLGS